MIEAPSRVLILPLTNSPSPSKRRVGYYLRPCSGPGTPHSFQYPTDQRSTLLINAAMLLPQGSIYLNDFARVVSSDHEAVNGVLHFIDRVLLPPDVLHWEADTIPIPRVCLGKHLRLGLQAGIPSSHLTV